MLVHVNCQLKLHDDNKAWDSLELGNVWEWHNDAVFEAFKRTWCNTYNSAGFNKFFLQHYAVLYLFFNIFLQYRGTFLDAIWTRISLYYLYIIQRVSPLFVISQFRETYYRDTYAMYIWHRLSSIIGTQLVN